MKKVSISLLKKQDIELEGEEPANLFDLKPNDIVTVTSPIYYHLIVRLVGEDVVVNGEFNYKISGECGRCLKKIEDDLQGTLYFDIPVEGREEVDITPVFREETLIVLPMNIVCSEDCKGLCDECGVNLNKSGCNCEGPPEEESPWGALDKLDL